MKPNQLKTMFSFGAGTILTQTSLADPSFCADTNMGKTGKTTTAGNCITINVSLGCKSQDWTQSVC